MSTDGGVTSGRNWRCVCINDPSEMESTYAGFKEIDYPEAKYWPRASVSEVSNISVPISDLKVLCRLTLCILFLLMLDEFLSRSLHGCEVSCCCCRKSRRMAAVCLARLRAYPMKLAGCGQPMAETISFAASVSVSHTITFFMLLLGMNIFDLMILG
jgi:hypothetical protein